MLQGEYGWTLARRLQRCCHGRRHESYQEFVRSFPLANPTCNFRLTVDFDKTAEGKEELEIEVLCTTPAGDNVRQAGSDAKKGTKVLDAGTVIGGGGGEVGLLGFVGKREVRSPI